MSEKHSPEAAISDTLGLFSRAAEVRSFPINPYVLAYWAWTKLCEAAERFEKERKLASAALKPPTPKADKSSTLLP